MSKTETYFHFNQIPINGGADFQREVYVWVLKKHIEAGGDSQAWFFIDETGASFVDVDSEFFRSGKLGHPSMEK